MKTTPIIVFFAASLVSLGAAGCRPDSSRAEQPETSGAKATKTDDDHSERKPQDMNPKDPNPKYSKSGYDVTPLSEEKVAELAAMLDEESFRITQQAGTERPFCGGLLDNKKEGVYGCVVCGLPLFSSEHKFHSGTGWPSFFREFDPQHVTRKADVGYGMVRTEINCARCGAHLGHVFDDGPPPTGERHCLNSASLTFYEKGTEPKPDKSTAATSLTSSRIVGDAASASQAKNAAQPKSESNPAAAPNTESRNAAASTAKTETAYFAAGCFWGVEHYFQKGPGVIDAASGYMQGSTEKPTYKEVCAGDTCHAETVKVVFDPGKITYRRLLEAFFKMHDPTQLNRQGPDVGDQYRSGIWYTSDQQKREAERYVQELQNSKRFGGKKIVTKLEAAKTFWPAEDYHQDYIVKTGRACHVTNPWE